MGKKRIAYRRLAIASYLFGLFMGSVIFPLLSSLNDWFWYVLQLVIFLCLAIIAGVVSDAENS